MAKTSIIIASAAFVFFGLLHLYGTFFSTDLHPDDMELIVQLKSSHIQMDESGNVWKLWLGFNAMFSMGLIFIGAINLYLSIKHFQFVKEQQFILLLTIAANVFLVWVGYQYVIRDFLISMSVPLLLFVTAFTLIQFKQARRVRQ